MSSHIIQTLTEYDNAVVEIERDVGVGTGPYRSKMNSNISRKRRLRRNSPFPNGACNSSSNIFELAYDREQENPRNCFSVSGIQFVQMKTLSVSNIFKTVHNRLHVSDCKFIRGGLDDHSVVGLWTGDQYNSIVYKLDFELSSQYSKTADEMPVVIPKVTKKGPFLSGTRIVDLCDTFYRDLPCFLYAGVTNAWGRSHDCISLHSSYSTSPHAYYCNLLYCEELYCCAGSGLDDFFAVGIDFGVYSSRNGQLSPIQMRAEVGKITALEFNKTADVLYCGSSEGSVILVDFREEPHHILYLISSRFEVSEVKLFSDEHAILVSGSNGSLLKVDLRMNKVAVQYPEHVGDGRKIPFNFNVHLNMLCATGSDNLTRLWSLDSGNLMSTIRPHFSKNNAYSYLVCNNDKWAVNIFQQNRMYTMEPSV